MSDFLTNITALLNWILNAFSTMNIFNNNSPIFIGIANTLTNMGIEPTIAINRTIVMFIFFSLMIAVVSFAVGIFLRIAGSR